MSLLRGLPKPPDRLLGVLLHAIAFVVGVAQYELGLRVFPHGRLSDFGDLLFEVIVPGGIYQLLRPLQDINGFELVHRFTSSGRLMNEVSANNGDVINKKADELISNRLGTNTNRSEGQEQIVEFRAVVAEDPDRNIAVGADAVVDDREYYGFPSHTEFSAGVAAMRLLASQSHYFPLSDALECVNGLGWEDPPIIVAQVCKFGQILTDILR